MDDDQPGVTRRCSLALAALLVLAPACSTEVATEEVPEPAPAIAARENGTLVDASNTVVELHVRLPSLDYQCTATVINRNSLVTAAHCGGGGTPYSLYPEIQVIAQENSTTWRCLTGLTPHGGAIRGDHTSVRASCPVRDAGFRSMFDYGTDTLTYETPTGEEIAVHKNDFAVVKVWDASFAWIGISSADYAAFYDDAFSFGWKNFYGTGYRSPTMIDFRVRTALFNVSYADNFNIGAFADDAQTCTADSGGPLGTFLPGTNRFAIVGVAHTAYPTTSPTAPFCGNRGAQTYWSNAMSRIWYVEAATGQTCRSVLYGSVHARECW